MILEILIVGINFNLMGCGGSSTATMIKNRKMKNEDPCACKDEWKYSYIKLTESNYPVERKYFKCDERKPSSQGLYGEDKTWCPIKNQDKCASVKDWWKYCDPKKEDGEELRDKSDIERLRKELKEKSNKYSATGEGGIIDQKLMKDIVEQAEIYNQELLSKNKKNENKSKEKTNVDKLPNTGNPPPTSKGYVSCRVPIEHRSLPYITGCLQNKLDNNYDEKKFSEYSKDPQLKNCFFKNNCIEYNECASKNPMIEEVECP